MKEFDLTDYARVEGILSKGNVQNGDIEQIEIVSPYTYFTDIQLNRMSKKSILNAMGFKNMNDLCKSVKLKNGVSHKALVRTYLTVTQGR